MKESQLPNKTSYIFKEYGTHEFIHLTYEEIRSNETLLGIINPNNLMDIHMREFLIKKQAENYRVVEESQNNMYTLENQQEVGTYSGEYIYDNLEMFENVNLRDLSKIIHTTGFIQGRHISVSMQRLKKLQAPRESETCSDNVIKFKPPELR